MSLALRQDDNKLALQKLKGLTVQKIIQASELWHDVSLELRSKAKALKEIEEDKTRKGRKQLVQAYKKDIEVLTLRLSKTVYLPTLIELSRQNEAELMTTLQLLIVGVVKYYHTTEKMNEDHIYEAAFRIMDTFKGLTLEDVALCFHKAKSGEYGTVFNRIDGAVLLDWLVKYQDRKQSVGMERQLQLHLQSKGSTYKNGGEYRVSDIQKINEYFK